jgi:hypothetical protein
LDRPIQDACCYRGNCGYALARGRLTCKANFKTRTEQIRHNEFYRKKLPAICHIALANTQAGRNITDVAIMYEENGWYQQAWQEVQFTVHGTHTLSVGASSVFRLCNIL